MSKSIITVENLSKKYMLGQIHTDLLSERLGGLFRKEKGISNRESQKEFWALKGVSFGVRQGEVVGIIGSNGAGKSTLLKILSRITSPTDGMVEMYGRVASLLEVGTGFHPELTGRENIFLNGAILGMSKAEVRKKFDEIVLFAEVEKFIDTPVKRYSSGMYVRLAFSVAAHLEPEILLVDEVLAVGDIAFQKKCLGKMEDVAQAGRTVFFVSHNMASIKKLCTRVIYLKGGKLIAEGPANDIVAQYLSENFSDVARADIPESMHRVSSPLQIRCVEFVNSQAQKVSAFEYGEEISIQLTLTTTEDVNDVRIGIGLVAEGVRVATIHTPAIEAIKQTTSFLIRCRIPQDVLLPNFYTVQLGAHVASTGRGLDWIPDVAVFQILDIATRNNKVIDEKELGLIRLVPDWEWQDQLKNREVDPS